MASLKKNFTVLIIITTTSCFLWTNFYLSSIQESNTVLDYEESKVTMLLGIMSYEKDFERQKYIRETYAKDPRICPLSDFFSGSNSDCRLPYVFVLGSSHGNKPTDHRDDSTPLVLDPPIDATTNDMVYLNIKENMNEGKSFTWFKYAATVNEVIKTGNKQNRLIDYVAKLDTDSRLSVTKLLSFIDNDLPPAPFNTNFYGGMPTGNVKLNTLYMQGQFYFLSMNLAHYIGHEITADDRLKRTTQYHTDGYFHVEDMAIGVLVHSHPRPIKITSIWKDIKFWKHHLKTEKSWTNEFTEEQLYGPHYMIPYRNMCEAYERFI